MIIGGLQKTSFVDYPDKIACTVFLHGCNFRCGYCHNPELVTGERRSLYDEGEVLDFLEKRKKYIQAVCISGGEPTINEGLEFFLRKIKDKGFLIKLDTNGSNPAVLLDLKNQGLVDYAAMDIKGSKELYPAIIGREHIDFRDDVEKGMTIITQFPNYEFRTTILRGLHDAKNFSEMMEWIKDCCGGGKLERYSLQGFRNNGKLVNPNIKEINVTKRDLLSLRDIALNYFKNVEIKA